MPRNIYLLLLLCCCSCINNNTQQGHQPVTYTTKNYIEVGKIMDTVKTPYVIDVQNNGKRIVFIGCVHDVDSSHPQFGIIGKYFKELQPQIAFNEGGQIPDSMHYASLNEAIKKDGETGTLKFYADQAGIHMQNGDMDAKTEFALTLQKQPKSDMFLYYVVERIAIPYHYGAYKNEPFDSVFNRIIARHFVKNGFPLTKQEQDITYFKGLYKKNIGHDFNIKDFDIEAFDYINNSCKFCAVGRTSKMVRDSILLSKIDQALNTYNKVMVTFGSGHALAVEPALKEIVDRKRTAAKQ